MQCCDRRMRNNGISIRYRAPIKLRISALPTVALLLVEGTVIFSNRSMGFRGLHSDRLPLSELHRLLSVMGVSCAPLQDLMFFIHLTQIRGNGPCCLVGQVRFVSLTE